MAECFHNFSVLARMLPTGTFNFLARVISNGCALQKRHIRQPLRATRDGQDVASALLNTQEGGPRSSQSFATMAMRTNMESPMRL